MNSIDPVNHLSCTILGLKAALLEAEKENRYLQKLLLSFYVKYAAKETDLYKMNLTGVKMNVTFQKEKQDLNLKIQELEARLNDSESENLNLTFQVRELKAFLEEKENLLELYNPKDVKSEKLLLNNLKEKDLIQIIRNVLLCMKKGRVSRGLQKSLRRLEQKKTRNLKKIKTEDTDGEMSDNEIDLMSTMIEKQLKEDDISFKCVRNESSELQFIRESSEMPPIDFNESDIIGAETNSSHGDAMDCISIDDAIFSPLSISDSDYSSNGVKSVESLNAEKIQSTESSCDTDTLLSQVDMKPDYCESSIALAKNSANPSNETDILEPELNAELMCKTILSAVSDAVLSAEKEDSQPTCETKILRPELNSEAQDEITALPSLSDDVSSSEEEDSQPTCETKILRPELIAEAQGETFALPELSDDVSSAEEEDSQPTCETKILQPELIDEARVETTALPAISDDDVSAEEENSKPSCETKILQPELNAEAQCEITVLPAITDDVLSAEEEDSQPTCETNILRSELNAEAQCETTAVLPVSDDVLSAEEKDRKPSCETKILQLELNAEDKCETTALPAERYRELSYETNVFLEKEDPKSNSETDNAPPKSNSKLSFETNTTPPVLNSELSFETNIAPPVLNAESSFESRSIPAQSQEEFNCETNLVPAALDAEPNSYSNIFVAERDISDSVQETVANPTDASANIQSDDSVTDPVPISECESFIDPKIVNSAAELIVSEMMNICYPSVIIKSFEEFCRNDVQQISEEFSMSKSTTSNPATPMAPPDVGHEQLPVKRRIDSSSENSDSKKIRLNENVSNSSAESTVFTFVPEENTIADKNHPFKDETNSNSSNIHDYDAENTSSSMLESKFEIGSKMEHQKTPEPDHITIQNACKSPDVLLLHPDQQSDVVSSSSKEFALDGNPCLKMSVGASTVHSEIGTLESYLDRPVFSLSDSQVSQRSLIKSIHDVSIEKKSDSNLEPLEVSANPNKVGETEPINEEVPVTNKTSSILEARKDLFCILNEFAALDKEMHQRMALFKEFLLQEDDYGAMQVLDKMEYIVVAEILEDNELELAGHEAFIDGNTLPDYILNSLYKTNLKTVEFQTSEENLNIYSEDRSSEKKFFTPAFDSTTEVNDTSDDEFDGLTIVEDDHVDNSPIIDTSFVKSDVLHDEENDRKLVSVHVPEKQVSISSDVHSLLKRYQPIKEITNIPRYNLRRSAAFTDSANETSRSSHSPPVESAIHLSECSRESVTSTLEEPSKTVRMQFYVENQTSTLNPPLHVSVFDEIWSHIKSNWCNNSSRVTLDPTDLIPCHSSIMKFVFGYRDPQTASRIRKEEVLDVASAVKSLRLFLKEKIRDTTLAFDAFSSKVCHSNKTTLCCAIIEIFLDPVTSNNARLSENVLRDLVNLSFKLDCIIFQGFVDALKNELKTRMWQKDWIVKENGNLVSDIRLLSKLYTRLCKSVDDSDSVISLLRDSLFSFKFRGHPIAYTVLEEWRDIFPCKAQERNAIAHIILFTLVNHRMDYNQQLYNIVEVQQLISNQFKVKLGMNTAEEYAKDLMLQLSDPTWEDAITLLCKRQMFPWTYTNVIMKYFLPILNKWKREYIPEEMLNKVLRALRTLLAACPLNKKDNELYKLDVIIRVLERILSSNEGSRELKETVILVLCDLSPLRFSLCVEILENWKPPGGVVSRNTYELLRAQIHKYKRQWKDFLFPRKNSDRNRRNECQKMNNFNGFRNKYNSRANNTHAVIAVGVTRQMNKNRPLPNRLLNDNPIPNRVKKKKKSKSKKHRKAKK